MKRLTRLIVKTLGIKIKTSHVITCKKLIVGYNSQIKCALMLYWRVWDKMIMCTNPSLLYVTTWLPFFVVVVVVEGGRPCTRPIFPLRKSWERAPRISTAAAGRTRQAEQIWFTFKQLNRWAVHQRQRVVWNEEANSSKHPNSLNSVARSISININPEILSW